LKACFADDRAVARDHLVEVHRAIGVVNGAKKRVSDRGV